MSNQLGMPSNHLLLDCPLLLLSEVFPSIRVFSNESFLCIRLPRYWIFSFIIGPPNEHSGLFSFRTDWLDLLVVQGTLKSLLQHHSSKTSNIQHSAFFIVQFSYMTIRETIAQSSQNFVGKEMSLHFNMLPRLVITFLSFSSKEQVYVLVQFFELSNFVGLTMPCLIQALSAVVVTGQMAL